ncbi:MAG: hypothetical protein R3B72_22780 [Polyangiaceae bacterium]
MTTECTNPDTCDNSGNCQDNHITGSCSLGTGGGGGAGGGTTGTCTNGVCL